MTAWWVVVNPAAGRGTDLGEKTRRALDQAGLDYQLAESATPDEVVDVVAAGIDAGFTDFASVGGDGTAHLVVNAMMAHGWDEPPTLAILPAGSGSDFIRTFALPRTLEGAVAHLTGDERYPTDLGRITGSFGSSYFLNAANAGLAARSVQRAGRLPDALGAARYTIGFWFALVGFQSADIRVEVDDRALEGDVFTVVVANGQFFGGGMNVAPRATVMDGVFDVQLFSGPRWHAPALMPRVMFGTHLSHKGVRRTKGSRISIHCPEEWPIEADGEMIGNGPVRIEVMPQAIEFKI